MTLRLYSLILSLQLALGCSDVATVGGLCVLGCESARDAGAPDACASGDCDASSTDSSRDACVSASCSSAEDAAPGCAAGSYALTRMSADLLLAVDDSASLAPWLAAVDEGVRSFLSETDPTGVRVGLARFGEDCDPKTYATPVVPIGPLGENRMQMLSALPTEPSLSTSTLATLDGALRYARMWAAAQSDGRVSLVLLTDASPGACDGLSGNYDGQSQQVAREAYESTPSVATYVIGVGPMLALDSLAAAGGTRAVRIAITPADGEVRAALEKVKHEAQPCAFHWQSRYVLASDSTIVVTAADGTQRQYPIVSDASTCRDGGGFYVDDPNSAYPLVACPSTCLSLTAADQIALSSACSSSNKN
jgi:hypothetical protein